MRNKLITGSTNLDILKMKTFLFISFFLLTTLVAAQSAPPPPPPGEMNEPDTWGSRYFHFGLNFTPGIYWVSPNTANNTANGSSLGYGYGANLEFYFTRNYGVVLGMEISTLGAKYTNSTDNPAQGWGKDSIINHDESLQYLQLPIMLKMKTSPFGRIRYFGLIGLDFGFRLKATDNYSGNNELFRSPPMPITIPFSANNVDISDQTNFFRASFIIGLGAEYELAGSTTLQASLVYNNTFTNLNSTDSSEVAVKGIELMVGILF